MRPCRREPERACTQRCIPLRGPIHRPSRWNLLRPARARKTARTPCSWPTQGAAAAVIGPNRHGPSKETTYYRVASGAAPASLRAGATWSRGPACGDATVEPALSVSPASCVPPRCGHSRRAQAWGGVAAQRHGHMSSNAALCAPARTTLRETESGAHPQSGPSSALRHA